MALKKVKLGDLLELCDERNSDLKYDLSYVRGISTKKEFIITKADMTGVKLDNYKIVFPGEIAYVSDTSRRGDKISLAINRNSFPILVSTISTVFKTNSSVLLSDYIMLYFSRAEFDRYSRFNSWGSARETFSWQEMCDIDIELPPIDVQKKYVDIYLAMLANQRAYEQGLDDLKLVCDAYIEDLRRKMPSEEIGKYLILSDRRNDLNLSVDFVRGLATSKEMIETKADMDGVKLDNYKVVLPTQIAYVSDTSRRADKMSLGYNNTETPVLVSSISIVFGTNTDYLLPDYLMLFLMRSEFDRYARFNSWGSARETFSWEEMCSVKIPIPPIEVQKSIAELYRVYNQRKEINEKLKAQIKDICPILVKGSIDGGDINYDNRRA